MTDLRQLEAAATPGPWFQEDDWTARNYVGLRRGDGSHMPMLFSLPQHNGEANAALITALRNAAPYLLDVVDAARKLNDAIDRGTEVTEGRWDRLDYTLAALDAHLEAKND